MSIHVCGSLRRPEERIGSLRGGVTDGRELPCGCWEQNSAPLQEPQVLLTAEASLQLLTVF